jgi:hypothetical protein
VWAEFSHRDEKGQIDRTHLNAKGQRGRPAHSGRCATEGGP